MRGRVLTGVNNFPNKETNSIMPNKALIAKAKMIVLIFSRIVFPNCEAVDFSVIYKIKKSAPMVESVKDCEKTLSNKSLFGA